MRSLGASHLSETGMHGFPENMAESPARKDRLTLNGKPWQRAVQYLTRKGFFWFSFDATALLSMDHGPNFYTIAPDWVLDVLIVLIRFSTVNGEHTPLGSFTRQD